MKKMKCLALINITFLTCFISCSIPSSPEDAVSQCESLHIARTALPARFSELAAVITLDTDEENKEIWQVFFPAVDVPFKDLGWEGDSSQYFKAASDSELEREMPEDVYANVVIYINSETGEITNREINNKVILGNPDMYAKCE